MTLSDNTKQIASKIGDNCKNVNNTSNNCENGKNNSNYHEYKPLKKKETDFKTSPLFAQPPTFATITGKDTNNEFKRYIGQLPIEKINELLTRIANGYKATNTPRKIVKSIINSGMNSGKTFFVKKFLFDYFKNIYKENFHIVYVSPRKLLTEQAANDFQEYNVIQYSSNKLGDKDKHGNPVAKFASLSLGNPNNTSASVTTFSGVGEIISKIKKYDPTAKILLVIDEIHELINGSKYMNLFVLEQFIKMNAIDFVTGFTATCNNSFTKQGYDIIKIDRTYKPQRDLEIRIKYEGKDYATKKRKALQDMVNTIIKRGYKTTITHINNLEDMQTFKELLIRATGKDNVYILNGQSTNKEREENKFLISILKKGNYPLINNHFVINKALDVGVNIKRNESENAYIDAVLYLAEQDYNVVNPFTFRQLPARARCFKNLPIILYIPNLTKHNRTEIDYTQTVKKALKLCIKLNEKYKIECKREHTESQSIDFDNYIHRAEKVGVLRFIHYNRFYKKFQVSRAKIYADIDEVKGMNTDLEEIINYLKQDYILTVDRNNDLSNAIEERAKEIEKKNRTQIKEDTKEVLSWCLSHDEFNLLAMHAIDNISDLRLQNDLKRSFSISDDFLLNIQHNPQYEHILGTFENEDGLLRIEAKRALKPLARKLITYSQLLNSICSNRKGVLKKERLNVYQNLVFEASKILSKEKVKLFTKRMQFNLIAEYIAKRGVKEFEKTQKVASLITEEHSFQKNLKKWVLSKNILGQRIFSDALLNEYTNEAENKDLIYTKTFTDRKEFVKYLNIIFDCDTSKKIGKEKCLIITPTLSPKKTGVSPKSFGVFDFFVKELESTFLAQKRTNDRKSKTKKCEKKHFAIPYISIKEDESKVLLNTVFKKENSIKESNEKPLKKKNIEGKKHIIKQVELYNSEVSTTRNTTATVKDKITMEYLTKYATAISKKSEQKDPKNKTNKELEKIPIPNPKHTQKRVKEVIKLPKSPMYKKKSV